MLLVPLLLLLAHTPGPDRELMIHVFRAPSMGVEIREGFLGLQLGLYPTAIDENDEGESRTTWFVKFGLAAYFLGFDTGSGRDSSPYVGLSLVQGLNNAWNVSDSIEHGSGLMLDVGFRWAVWRGLDLRLGGNLLVGFDGRVGAARAGHQLERAASPVNGAARMRH